MSVTAIEVEQLGKRYILGGQPRSYSLREAVTGALSAGTRWLKSALRREAASNELAFWALRDVSFSVTHGDVVGVVGRNGAGKSTLLKLLTRITNPTEGRIVTRGRVASLLEVGTGFHPELTGRENIYMNGAILGMFKAEIDRKFDEIVSFAEIEKFLDTPVKRYSSGMYVRLAFAVAAHLEPEILLVDEVLAVGDTNFQRKCLGKMGDVARQGRTVLFVSHNMAAVQSLCTTGILLEQGHIAVQGDLTTVISRYMGQVDQHTVTFADGPLRSARIRQVGDTVELLAAYAADRPLRVPCLGFVISDYMGNPICGTNPLRDELPRLPDSSQDGCVRMTMRYPKLYNGSYRVSLWFGDGVEDYTIARDCLVLDIVNMASLNQKADQQAGPVHPTCEWSFE